MKVLYRAAYPEMDKEPYLDAIGIVKETAKQYVVDKPYQSLGYATHIHKEDQSKALFETPFEAWEDLAKWHGQQTEWARKRADKMERMLDQIREKALEACDI